MEQEFAVSFLAFDGRIGLGGDFKAGLLRVAFHGLERFLAFGRFGDDALIPISDLFSDLELRLYEGDNGATFFNKAKCLWQDVLERYERDVDGRHIDGRGGLEFPDIGVLMDFNAGVVSQAFRKLVGAYVHGDHFFRAVLEQAVDEAAARRADIDYFKAADVDFEFFESMGELLARSAGERRSAVELDLVRFEDLAVRFGNYRSVHADLVPLYEVCGGRARAGYAAGEERDVEPHAFCLALFDLRRSIIHAHIVY